MLDCPSRKSLQAAPPPARFGQRGRRGTGTTAHGRHRARCPCPAGPEGPPPQAGCTRRLPRPRAGRRTAHLPRVWGGLCPRRPPARPARPACARAQPARPRVLSLVLLLHSRARARGSSPHGPPCEQGPRRLRDCGHGASAAAGQLPSVCPFKFHAAKPSSSQSCSVPLPYHVCKNRKVEIFNYSERSSFKLYI